ncbi:response regulator transcription factor [Paenibacillus sp. Root444D2]|uniref:response regulator transcription factor n=1 Tax=Paenibacillus sp. Root444D2 TaxID=1736538 RepID=UPI0007104B73|nr:response regulator transcription factor [Paenibacillus sp. Root444D2]KQX45214.1 two-component system response regulator [Paenibacillus sp. Root444D2]
MIKVLIIEDDIIIGQMISMYLSEDQFEVKQSVNGHDGLREIVHFQPDVILLDLVLPDYEGLELCGAIRELSSVPIIVISTKTNIKEKVEAFNIGADDYLCKPFSMQELKARIKASLRMSDIQVPVAGGSEGTECESQYADFTLDVERRLIVIKDQKIDITNSEFEIMKRFIHYPGRVFRRDELIDTLYRMGEIVNDRAIDVHITNLRRKIEQNPKEPQYIKTVWGVGYKFVHLSAI